MKKKEGGKAAGCAVYIYTFSLNHSLIWAIFVFIFNCFDLLFISENRERERENLEEVLFGPWHISAAQFPFGLPAWGTATRFYSANWALPK